MNCNNNNNKNITLNVVDLFFFGVCHHYNLLIQLLFLQKNMSRGRDDYHGGDDVEAIDDNDTSLLLRGDDQGQGHGQNQRMYSAF